MEIKAEIEKTLSELFDLIGIKASVVAEIEKSSETENEEVYKVSIDTDESTGLLIGAHGMTLSAIQSFLAVALKQKTGEWVKISLDIAGWTEKQNERLVELAEQAKERALQTGEEQRLYNLNASSRRVVHMALADSKEIETLSEGEGQDRYLIIKVRK